MFSNLVISFKLMATNFGCWNSFLALNMCSENVSRRQKLTPLPLFMKPVGMEFIGMEFKDAALVLLFSTAPSALRAFLLVQLVQGCEDGICRCGYHVVCVLLPPSSMQQLLQMMFCCSEGRDTFTCSREHPPRPSIIIWHSSP